MPKFCMYHYSGNRLTEHVEGRLETHVPDRLSKVSEWLQKAFIDYPRDMRAGSTLNACFVSLRTRENVFITVEDGSPLTKVIIQCDSMEVVGDMVQDMCAYLNVQQIDSVAHFPAELEHFREVLERVDEFNAARLKMTAEMVDSSNLLKTLVVKAEDYRLINDMNKMKRTYLTLAQINSDLFTEYTKRAMNHQELMSQLKTVNNMIQKAANLRVGAGKARVVTACRNAIKQNNINELFQILRDGGASVASAAR
jgi:Bardet-Biedl syndrome 2 protein